MKTMKPTERTEEPESSVCWGDVVTEAVTVAQSNPVSREKLLSRENACTVCIRAQASKPLSHQACSRPLTHRRRYGCDRALWIAVQAGVGVFMGHGALKHPAETALLGPGSKQPWCPDILSNPKLPIFFNIANTTASFVLICHFALSTWRGKIQVLHMATHSRIILMVSSSCTLWVSASTGAYHSWDLLSSLSILPSALLYGPERRPGRDD